MFSCILREKTHHRLKELGVKRWVRYVNGIFATFHNKDEEFKFLNLNFLIYENQHLNLKFTIEYEKNNQLSFLDILKIRNSYQYFNSLYRKPLLLVTIYIRIV